MLRLTPGCSKLPSASNAIAGLRLAAPPATDEMIRLRELITGGQRGDGITLRTMVRYRRKDERALGFLLSDVVEGKAPVPPTL